jgi:hypothetical protein
MEPLHQQLALLERTYHEAVEETDKIQTEIHKLEDQSLALSEEETQLKHDIRAAYQDLLHRKVKQLHTKRVFEQSQNKISEDKRERQKSMDEWMRQDKARRAQLDAYRQCSAQLRGSVLAFAEGKHASGMQLTELQEQRINQDELIALRRAQLAQERVLSDNIKQLQENIHGQETEQARLQARKQELDQLLQQKESNILQQLQEQEASLQGQEHFMTQRIQSLLSQVNEAQAELATLTY